MNNHMYLRLGVNIDHVATLRNARGVTYPSPLEAAKIVKKTGADQITIHLREDKRHINEKDAINIIKKIKMDINLEIAPIEHMIKFAIKNKPDYVCLVPEKRQEITTEGGINLNNNKVIKSIYRLKKNNIKTCLFIDPNIKNIKICNKLNIKFIELHTGGYANKTSKKSRKLELKKIIKCAKLAKKFNINCHAGHGLNFNNVIPIIKIPEIRELNIGHFIISNSIYFGLEKSIKMMIKLIKKYRK